MTHAEQSTSSPKTIDHLRQLLCPTPADVIMFGLFVATLFTVVTAEFLLRRHGFIGPYWTFLSPDPFVSYALLSLGVVHVWAMKNWRESLAVVALSMVGWILIGDAKFQFVYTGLQQAAYAIAFGTGAVQLIGLGHAMMSSQDLVKRIRLARDCAMFALASAIPGPMIHVSSYINPVLDGFAAAFDDNFGIRIVTATHLVLAPLPAVHDILTVIYYSTPGVIAIVFALQAKALPRLPLTVSLAATIGFLLYLALPVVGPIYAYPHYAASLWPIADFDTTVAPLVSTKYPRNCMPSLHAAWAYLIVFATYGLSRPIRIAAMSYCVLTLVAAIEIGNHWFIDLVIALPLALAIQALVCFSLPMRDPARLGALATGISLTVLYFALLLAQPLTFPGSTLFHWAMLIGTLYGATVLWQRLARRLVEVADGAQA